MSRGTKWYPLIIAGVIFVIFLSLIGLNRILGIGFDVFGVFSESAGTGSVLTDITKAAVVTFLLLCLLKVLELKCRQVVAKKEKSLKLLSTLIQDSPVAILFIKNNKAVWVSKAVEDILGWPVKKWLKEPSVAFIYSDEEEFERTNKKIIYKDITRSDRIVYEYDYCHKDGHRVPVLVIMRAINKDNLDEGFIFSMIDNTERKKAALLIKKLNEGLEQKIKERTQELKEKVDELERFREATIDRELRMKELKEDIARLSLAAKGQTNKNES